MSGIAAVGDARGGDTARACVSADGQRLRRSAPRDVRRQPGARAPARLQVRRRTRALPRRSGPRRPPA
eukprot:8906782-Alexandrium_andersonii.AAC.1